MPTHYMPGIYVDLAHFIFTTFLRSRFLILQMRKQEIREVQKVAQDHPAEPLNLVSPVETPVEIRFKCKQFDS